MLTSDDEMRIGNSEICTMLLTSLLQLKGMKTESVSHSVMFDSATPLTVGLPGSSVHGILQARILEWVSISFSRASSCPKD